MDNEAKIELIKRNVEEIVPEGKLGELLSKKSKVVYCGYEPNGPMHLGHFVTITKLMDFAKAGFKVKVLLADVHALLNRKGEEGEIKKEVERWKKTLKAIGLDFEVVKGSDFQFKREYQIEVMKLAQVSSISRGTRSMQEIARDFENATISQLWYPLMQVVDIKELQADVALGGMEQRKVHMLGRDLAKTFEHDFVAVHTPLISSLRGPGEGKMSKSIKGSWISVTDSYDDIKRAINNAYCPEMELKNNPVLQIARLIIFPRVDFIEIKRAEKFGGNLKVTKYKDLEELYSVGDLHPADLKNAVADELERIIAPIRKNFK